MKVYVYVRLLSSFNEFLLKARPVLCMGLHSVLPPLKVTLKVNFLKTLRALVSSSIKLR